MIQCTHKENTSATDGNKPLKAALADHRMGTEANKPTVWARLIHTGG